MTTSIHTDTRATVSSFREGNTCFVILNAKPYLLFKKFVRFQSIFDCKTDLIVKQKKHKVGTVKSKQVCYPMHVTDVIANTN